MNTTDNNNNGMIATDVLAPTRIIAGKYHLGKIIGEGGMGAVYEAEHHALGTTVAVKLLSEASSNNPKSLARFRREAKVMGQIQHENVVAVMDAGTDKMGIPFLVMEKLEGESLSATLRREIRLSIGLSAWIISEILAGLGAAHSKNIVHRDLKPGNVFIATQSDGSRRVKLLDFGISKLGDSSETLNVTAAGALVGTPNFMAPEQIRANVELDSLVDVYAVGILFYRLITGKLPYVAGSPEQLYRTILEGKATSPRELCPELQPDLEAVLSRGMHPDRNKRFQSAYDFQVALQDVIPTENFTPGRQLSNIQPVEINPKHKRASKTSIPSKAGANQSYFTSNSKETSGGHKPWRWLVGMIILLSAITAGVLTYFITKTNERNSQAITTPALTGTPLIFGITRHKDPNVMKKELAPLARYLSNAVKRPIEVRILDSYEGFTQHLSDGTLDFAALSAFNYVNTKTALKNLPLLGTPTNSNGSTYGAYILTNTNSGIQSLKDLKGKTICYPSKTSSSGYVYPRSVFMKAGIDPDKHLIPRFTSDHSASLKALLNGGCDVASVYAKAFLDSKNATSFSVLKSTKRIPWDAYCASPTLDTETTSALRLALTNLQIGSEQAKTVLTDAGLNFSGFIAPDDSLYDSVRDIIAR